MGKLLLIKPKFVLLLLACTAWCSTGELNTCCSDNATLEDKQCANNVSVWASNMCEAGLSRIYTSAYCIRRDDSVILRTNGKVLLPNEYCLAKTPTEKEPVIVHCDTTEAHRLFLLKLLKFSLNIFSLFLTVRILLIYTTLPYLKDLLSNCIVLVMLTYAGILFLNVFQFYIYIEYIQEFVLPLIQISVFFWLTVLSFELLRLVTRTKFFPKKKHMLLLYMLYGWGVPLSILAAITIIDFAPGDYILPYFKNPYWDNESQAWLLYFFGPIFVTSIFTIVMFSLTSRALWKKTKVHIGRKYRSQKFKLVLCVKLHAVMTFSWIFPIIFATMLFNNDDSYWLLNNYITSGEGIMVYFVLVLLRKRVRQDLASRSVCCTCSNENEERNCVDLDEEEEEMTSCIRTRSSNIPVAQINSNCYI